MKSHRLIYNLHEFVDVLLSHKVLYELSESLMDQGDVISFCYVCACMFSVAIKSNARTLVILTTPFRAGNLWE